MMLPLLSDDKTSLVSSILAEAPFTGSLVDVFFIWNVILFCACTVPIDAIATINKIYLNICDFLMLIKVISPLN
ncbi:hypothetical protein D3C85_1194330 [compost metagenome]